MEIAFPISARDVHMSKGVWVVNQKAKKGVEVNFRQLQAHEKKGFEQTMQMEVGSSLSTEVS